MFTAALFTAAKIWKQPKSVSGWMDTNSGYIHTEYYSASRKDSSHLQKHGGALSTLCGDKSDKDTVWSHVEI